VCVRTLGYRPNGCSDFHKIWYIHRLLPILRRFVLIFDISTRAETTGLWNVNMQCSVFRPFASKSIFPCYGWLFIKLNFFMRLRISLSTFFTTYHFNVAFSGPVVEIIYYLFGEIHKEFTICLLTKWSNIISYNIIYDYY